MRYHACTLVLAVGLIGASQNENNASAPEPFVAHEIATGLRGGYQTIVADLNKDGRPDIIALAQGLPELVWYENPSWQRHVLADGFTGLINVSAIDLDDDGIPELAVASAFSTQPDKSAGIVSLLTHRADLREPWSVRELDRVPMSHRVRWYTSETGQKWLINAPLAGAASQQPDYKGASPIYFYRPPEWKREQITDAEQGVVHDVEPVRWEGTLGQVLLSAGFTGIHRYQFVGGRWNRADVVSGDPAPWPKSGSSDVVVAHLGGDRFLAAIEPWHGNQVVVYRERAGAWQRRVIDDSLSDGHTIVAIDVDGDGRDEIVAGQRGGTRSVYVYKANDAGEAWSRTTLDDGGMAAAGCAVADFNGDRRPDVVCIGTATANLKWYENAGRK